MTAEFVIALESVTDEELVTLLDYFRTALHQANDSLRTMRTDISANHQAWVTAHHNYLSVADEIISRAEHDCHDR